MSNTLSPSAMVDAGGSVRGQGYRRMSSVGDIRRDCLRRHQFPRYRQVAMGMNRRTRAHRQHCTTPQHCALMQSRTPPMLSCSY